MNILNGFIQNISDDYIRNLTIFSVVLALIGTIYSSFEGRSDSKGILRLFRVILQLAIPMLFTMLFGSLLALLALALLFLNNQFHFFPDDGSIWILIGILILIAGMVGIFHGIFSTEDPGRRMTQPAPGKRRLRRLWVRICSISWWGAVTGFVLGAFSCLAYWAIVIGVLTKSNPFTQSEYSVVMGILGAFGGIGGFVWNGWVRPPLPSKDVKRTKDENRKPVVFHKSQFSAEAIVHFWRRFKTWAFVRPNEPAITDVTTTSSTVVMASTTTSSSNVSATTTNTASLVVAERTTTRPEPKSLRPAYFSVDDGRVGCALWFWLIVPVLIFVTIVIISTSIYPSQNLWEGTVGPVVILSGLSGCIIIVGWFASGIACFTKWLVFHSNQLGKIGLILTLVSFFLAAADPVLHDFKTSCVFTARECFNHDAGSTAVAWSPKDANTIASVDDYGNVYIENVKTNSTRTIKDTYQVKAIGWSSDGKYIAYTRLYRGIQVFKVETGERIRWDDNASCKDPTDLVITAISWSPDDGPLIAFEGTDSNLQVWNVLTCQRVRTFPGHPGAINAIAWSHNGKYIASTSANKVYVWDTTNGNLLNTYTDPMGNVTTLAWSQDDYNIASGGYDETVQIWDALSGDPVLTYHDYPSLINSLAWSPDGKHIACAGSDGKVQVWDSKTGNTTFVYQGHKKPVESISWSSDSQFIASGSDDGTVQVWSPHG